MTTKFNKDMYAKMRPKKDKPLSSIGKKGVCVTGKGSSVTPVTSATPIVSTVETVKTASPAPSMEEISTPSSKRLRTSGREREKLILTRPPCGATRSGYGQGAWGHDY